MFDELDDLDLEIASAADSGISTKRPIGGQLSPSVHDETGSRQFDFDAINVATSDIESADAQPTRHWGSPTRARATSCSAPTP